MKTLKLFLLFTVLLFTSNINAQESTQLQEPVIKSFEQTLLPYIDKLLKTLETGVETISEEIPLVLSQYILYEAIMAWIIILFSLISLFFITKVVKYLHKDDPEWKYPFVFSGICLYIIPISLIINDLDTAIQATFMPKLFLLNTFLEYI